MDSKTLAIVVLLAVCITQMSFISLIFYLGYEEIKNEENCIDICYEIEGSDSYLYQSDRCYCYKDMEIIHTEKV